MIENLKEIRGDHYPVTVKRIAMNGKRFIKLMQHSSYIIVSDDGFDEIVAAVDEFTEVEPQLGQLFRHQVSA